MLRQQAYRFGGRIIVIALVGLLDTDMVKLQPVQQIAREFTAAALEIGAFRGVPGDHALNPELRQEGKGENPQQQENDQRRWGLRLDCLVDVGSTIYRTSLASLQCTPDCPRRGEWKADPILDL